MDALVPGPVWTPLNPADKTTPDVKKFGKKTDFKRVAQPEELSPACAGYTIGIVLPVTGSVAAI